MIYFLFMDFWTFVLYALDLYLVPDVYLPVYSSCTFLLLIIYFYYLSKKKKKKAHCFKDEDQRMLVKEE